MRTDRSGGFNQEFRPAEGVGAGFIARCIEHQVVVLPLFDHIHRDALFRPVQAGGVQSADRHIVQDQEAAALHGQGEDRVRTADQHPRIFGKADGPAVFEFAQRQPFAVFHVAADGAAVALVKKIPVDSA